MTCGKNIREMLQSVRRSVGKRRFRPERGAFHAGLVRFFLGGHSFLRGKWDEWEGAKDFLRGGFSGWGNKPEGTSVLGLREKVENQSFEGDIWGLSWGLSLRRKKLSGMTIYVFFVHSRLSYFSYLILCDFNFACWVTLFWWLLV